MISSLLADVVESFRGRRASTRRFQPFASPPRIELLEERYLLTSTTTVPSVSEIPAQIALGDMMAASQPKGNPTVVWVGDSIGWEYDYGTGAPVWWSLMAPLGMVDYGVSGQTTQSLLYQLSLGQLSGINPSVVVLDIGGNNLLQGNSPQQTAAGVLADVAAIHQDLPNAQIVLLAVLPGKQSPNDPYRSEGAQTNQLVSQMLAGDPKVTYVNLGSIFVQPDGTISSSMMFDYLHPSEQGYIDLTLALLPVIEEAVLMNPTTPAPSTVTNSGTSPPSDSSVAASLAPTNSWVSPPSPSISTPPA
jgi:lysophospholipase L1-like esterase